MPRNSMKRISIAVLVTAAAIGIGVAIGYWTDIANGASRLADLIANGSSCMTTMGGRPAGAGGPGGASHGGRPAGGPSAANAAALGLAWLKVAGYGAVMAFFAWLTVTVGKLRDRVASKR